jgi:hypothetical protein
MSDVKPTGDATHTTCLRCQAQAELYRDDTGRMRAHRDPRVGYSCPFGGLTIEEGALAIDAAKRRLQEVWRRS